MIDLPWPAGPVRRTTQIDSDDGLAAV